MTNSDVEAFFNTYADALRFGGNTKEAWAVRCAAAAFVEAYPESAPVTTEALGFRLVIDGETTDLSPKDVHAMVMMFHERCRAEQVGSNEADEITVSEGDDTEPTDWCVLYEDDGANLLIDGATYTPREVAEIIAYAVVEVIRLYLDSHREELEAARKSGSKKPAKKGKKAKGKKAKKAS